jgi:hypothetical protein
VTVHTWGEPTRPGARASRPPERQRRILAGMRARGARTRVIRVGRAGGVSSLACAPEARAPMNLNGARAARLRCGSEGKMPALPEDNVNTYD